MFTRPVLVVVQECCYRMDGLGGPLITEESSQAGTLTLTNDDLEVTDDMAFSFCCDSDEFDGRNMYCPSYYSVRPVNDCSGFAAAIRGTYVTRLHVTIRNQHTRITASGKVKPFLNCRVDTSAPLLYFSHILCICFMISACVGRPSHRDTGRL